MLDLTKIPDDILRARGEYSTVRAAHEDEKKALAKLCGMLQTVPYQILRKMQPDDDDTPLGFDDLVQHGRDYLDQIAEQCKTIESLAEQRKELKSRAWATK